MQPPETLPTTSPAAETAIAIPGNRGALPCTFTTLTSTNGVRMRYQAAAASRTSCISRHLRLIRAGAPSALPIPYEAPNKVRQLVTQNRPEQRTDLDRLATPGQLWPRCRVPRHGALRSGTAARGLRHFGRVQRDLLRHPRAELREDLPRNILHAPPQRRHPTAELDVAHHSQSSTTQLSFGQRRHDVRIRVAATLAIAAACLQANGSTGVITFFDHEAILVVHPDRTNFERDIAVECLGIDDL